MGAGTHAKLVEFNLAGPRVAANDRPVMGYIDGDITSRKDTTPRTRLNETGLARQRGSRLSAERPEYDFPLLSLKLPVECSQTPFAGCQIKGGWAADMNGATKQRLLWLCGSLALGLLALSAVFWFHPVDRQKAPDKFGALRDGRSSVRLEASPT